MNSYLFTPLNLFNHLYTNKTQIAMTAEQYDNLPQNIKDIVDSWDDNKNLYSECNRIKKELERNGWTCDYGLDGMVYDVEKINR